MKTKLKLILDIIMLSATLTLFNKSLISLAYHEIAGLILIAVMIVHIALNIKTIRAMCLKFIKIPSELKVGVVVDALLILCFAWIGISGIFISRTILTSISSDNMIFKLGHMFAGGLSVILLGVHIGLHIYHKPMRHIIACIITVIVFAGGIYGALNSSELRWLSIPFTAVQSASETPHNEKDSGDVRYKSNEANETDKTDPSEHETTPESKVKKDRGSVSVPQKAVNVLTFLCMILSCTMITYWLVLIKKRVKGNRGV